MKCFEGGVADPFERAVGLDFGLVVSDASRPAHGPVEVALVGENLQVVTAERERRRELVGIEWGAGRPPLARRRVRGWWIWAVV